MSESTRRPGRKPEWLKTRLPGPGRFKDVARLIRGLGLHTVCVEARCPNLGECWGRGAVTVMILGDKCTRTCRFCNVDHHRPDAPDPDEPEKVARALGQLGLKYAVITSVTRDDLPDGGAAHWAATIRAVHRAVPSLTVEVLVPDFRGSRQALQTVFDARPEVFSHNLETVRRLSAHIRPQADYERSLEVLRLAGQAGLPTKSGLMVGLGETDEEVRGALEDLRSVGVRFVSIGQYLQPSRRHHPVARYVHPDQFEEYRTWALELGFEHAASGPLVRSSYRADELAEIVEGAEGAAARTGSVQR